MTRFTILSILVLSVIAGCGGKDNRRPAEAAAVKPAPTTPMSPATTAEEKIKRIQGAPLSEKEKEAAIERVRAGKL